MFWHSGLEKNNSLIDIVLTMIGVEDAEKETAGFKAD